MKYRFGICGPALQWFQSYLSDRKQQVVVSDHFSSEVLLQYGVPQGSILGPILFTLFISPLGDICRKYDIKFHSYADDQQLYCSVDPKSPVSVAEAVDNLQNCITEIRSWMRVNRLKLNDSKTEFIILGNKSGINRIKDWTTIKIGDDVIKPVDNVRNLGFQLNCNLQVKDHVSKTCSTSYLMLKKLNTVKYWIDKNTKRILAQALVISKLDYCNSLLLGSPKRDLQRLQYIQNMCARFVSGVRKYDHITPTLKALHWLKVEYRIDYKILTLLFKCITGCAPKYLCDAIHTEHSRALRSSHVENLPVTRCNLSKTMRSCFVHAAPRMWNKLPENIKTAQNVDIFKSLLKTHLFSLCYNS